MDNVLADKVFDWLTSLPVWQRDLARRLSGQVDLDDCEYDEAMAMMRGVFGLEPDGSAPAPWPVTRDDLSAGGDEADVRILRLGGMEGVGLVGAGEDLTFGQVGLTIIYGQNAAGKSSYVRVLKKLCRTVDRDCQIRGSIFDAHTPRPSARVEYSNDGQVVARRTRLDADVDVRLPGMSVFDTACAELYVGAQNMIQYIPTELRLLARLAALQDRMRRDIAETQTALQKERPDVVPYPSTTAVGQALRTLTASTSAPDLAALARLDDAANSRLAELRHAVAAAQTSTLRADAAAAAREADEVGELASALTDLAGRAGSGAAAALRASAAVAREAQEAVTLAAEQLQGPIPGIGGGPWQVLWNAARSFVASSDGTFPPATGQPCPLCLQSVPDDVAARMTHFEEHVTGVVQQTAEECESALREALAASSPRHAEEVGENKILMHLREREPELSSNLDGLTAELRQHLVEMTAAPERATGCAVDVSAATGPLLGWRERRSAHARTLREADDSAKLPELQAALAELEAKERLGQNLHVFQVWQQKLRTLRGLEDAHSALATNKITMAQRTLIEDGLAKELDAALGDELCTLACALPVQMRTQIARAETSVALRLLASDPPRVSEIASEGERRALALCFFLAELRVANDVGGVVLDDPVSSLDDERRTCIANRLVSEAVKRQVIVFTHDLPFVFELRSLAKKAGVDVHVQHIWRQGDDVGRVDQYPPFKTMDIKKRVIRLAEEVEEMRKNRPADNDEAWRKVDGFYKRVRTSWERAVEERLFGGVVERFERDVKTMQFRNIRVTPERIRACEDGMTRGSRFVHEDAYAAQVPLPSVKDMAEDVEALRSFERETRPDS